MAHAAGGTGAGTGSLVGLDLEALGIPSLADYVELIVARTGLDPRPHLPAYLAYNFFRIAAILQGIVGRVRDGTATNEHAAGQGQMVRPLAATALATSRSEAGAQMKTFALALGGGGARGLAHIVVARGARRDGREAGRDRRHLDRRADRRGLCGRHERPRDAPLRHRTRAQPHRGDAPR